MAKITQVKAGVEQSNEAVDREIYDEYNDRYLAADGKTPCTIGVVGKDSEHYRTEVAKFSRSVQRMPRVEQEKVDWRRNLAACGIVRWSGWDDEQGKPWPCSRENVLALLAADHILEQVESFVRDHARFFAKASRS